MNAHGDAPLMRCPRCGGEIGDDTACFDCAKYLAALGGAPADGAADTPTDTELLDALADATVMLSQSPAWSNDVAEVGAATLVFRLCGILRKHGRPLAAATSSEHVAVGRHPNAIAAGAVATESAPAERTLPPVPPDLRTAFGAGWFACDPDADGEEREAAAFANWWRAYHVYQPLGVRAAPADAVPADAREAMWDAIQEYVRCHTSRSATTTETHEALAAIDAAMDKLARAAPVEERAPADEQREPRIFDVLRLDWLEALDRTLREAIDAAMGAAPEERTPA